MASRIPRVASTARQLIVQSSRAPVSRFAASTSPRPAIFFLQRRYASHAPHYDPAPKPIEDILYIQHAEPSTPEEWKEIGISALRACKTQADRDAVQTYITNQLKPKLTDEEVIAVASQVGVQITTPEELESAHAVFKQVMTSATLTEAEALFTYFEKTGEFPADIKTVLADSFTKAAGSPPSAADHHDHHDDHGHGHGSAHAETKEAFGIGWYLALGAIPFSAILFFLTRSKTSEGNEPYITRLISKYDHWREEWALRNELHTKSVEQAGFDRLLFRHAATSEGRGVGRKDVRFEDSINQGPPINVTPGSYANVDKVIEHYKKLNEETEEKRLKIEEYYREKARQAA